MECKVLERDSLEYRQLELVAQALTKQSKKGRKYYVQDTYLDYGQDWRFTTICYNSSWVEYTTQVQDNEGNRSKHGL